MDTSNKSKYFRYFIATQKLLILFLSFVSRYRRRSIKLSIKNETNHRFNKVASFIASGGGHAAGAGACAASRTVPSTCHADVSARTCVTAAEAASQRHPGKHRRTSLLAQGWHWTDNFINGRIWWIIFTVFISTISKSHLHRDLLQACQSVQ